MLVEDRIFLGKEDFDFVQILRKFAQIDPNYVQICREKGQIWSRGCCGRILCIPSSYGTVGENGGTGVESF